MYHFGFQELLIVTLLAANTLAADVLEPAENLVVEGVPDIPTVLVEEVSRYTEARSAAVLDWHPVRREVLISTRFGNTSQVHLVSAPGAARTQLTFFREPVGNAAFDPREGKFLLLAKDSGGNEFHQFFRFDQDTSRAALLTDGGRSQNGSWVWNRAQDRIAYASTARNGADRDIWTLHPADPQSRRILAELPGGGWSPQDWSHDDRHILAREYLSINRSRLHLLDVGTGARRLVTPADQEISYDKARFSHDPTKIYVTSDLDREFLRLATVDLATGKQTPLPIDLPWDIEDFELSPDGKQIAYTANVAGAAQLFLYQVETEKSERINAWPPCQIGLGPWRANGEEFAVTVNSPLHPSDCFSVDARTHAVTRWTQSELGGLSSNDLAPARLIEWTSFDGRAISGFLYRSPKFAGKRPVIINIHGGPEGQSRPMFLGRNNYFVDELGMVLIFPNVRGSAGYGRAFLKLDNGVLREDSVRDIGALLDWIAKQPDLDAGRIMITGGSYGGYMTLACATHFNDRIAASLDVVGISHFGTFLKRTESYRRDLRRVEYGDERDPKIAAFFDRIAPLNHAEKITKPLFVVQGGNDPRVPLSESEQMVARVKQNGSPVWYLMAKDEGHGFRKKNNVDFQFYATVLFVKKFLVQDAAPRSTE